VNLDSSRLVLLLAADVAAVLGVVGLVLVRRAEQRTGLSLTSTATSVNVIGSDTGAAPGMLVREPTLGLRGRPDYVVEYGAPNERRLYPLEVKPTPGRLERVGRATLRVRARAEPHPLNLPHADDAWGRCCRPM